MAEAFVRTSSNSSNVFRTAVVVEIEEAVLDRVVRELEGIPNGLNRALVPAINDTLRQGRTLVVRQLAAVLTAKSANIRGRTAVVKATWGNPSGLIKILGRRIGLINFKTREKRQKKGWGTKESGSGVQAQAYKGGPWDRFPNAFIAVLRSANIHVVERSEGAGGKRVPRRPLVVVQGFSLLTVYRDHPDWETEVLEKIAGVLGERVLSKVDFLLGRRKVDRPA